MRSALAFCFLFWALLAGTVVEHHVHRPPKRLGPAVVEVISAKRLVSGGD